MADFNWRWMGDRGLAPAPLRQRGISHEANANETHDEGPC